MADKITCFRDKYAFLSNFHPCTIVCDGMCFQNAEAAFQAQKVFDFETRRKFSELSPSEAKGLGRKVDLRSDWESEKDGIMLDVCRKKFLQNADIAKKLCDTGDAELIETNSWGDTYWGVSKGKGKNMLGKILMQVRAELRGE